MRNMIPLRIARFLKVFSNSRQPGRSVNIIWSSGLSPRIGVLCTLYQRAQLPELDGCTVGVKKALFMVKCIIKFYMIQSFTQNPWQNERQVCKVHSIPWAFTATLACPVYDRECSKVLRKIDNSVHMNSISLIWVHCSFNDACFEIMQFLELDCIRMLRFTDLQRKSYEPKTQAGKPQQDVTKSAISVFHIFARQHEKFRYKMGLAGRWTLHVGD